MLLHAMGYNTTWTEASSHCLYAQNVWPHFAQLFLNCRDNLSVNESLPDLQPYWISYRSKYRVMIIFYRWNFQAEKKGDIFPKIRSRVLNTLCGSSKPRFEEYLQCSLPLVTLLAPEAAVGWWLLLRKSLSFGVTMNPYCRASLVVVALHIFYFTQWQMGLCKF